MNDIFSPFATTAAPGTEPKTTLTPVEAQFAEPQVVERKKRGPRRGSKHVAKEAKVPKKKGRPAKLPKPAMQPAGDIDLPALLPSLVGFQTEDVRPILAIYGVLSEMAHEDRERVLGIINKVFR